MFPDCQTDLWHLHLGLAKNVIEKLRSSSEISSLNDCILQLLYNSLDADAGSVLIGVDFARFSVEVYDDGVGLTEQDLNLVGERLKKFVISSKNY